MPAPQGVSNLRKKNFCHIVNLWESNFLYLIGCVIHLRLLCSYLP